MIRILLGLTACLLAASPAHAAERRYTVTDFDKVQVEGPYEVVLTAGRSPAAAATGSAQALDRLAVTVEGRTLRIRPNRSTWGGYPGDNAGPVRLVVGGHAVRSALVTGSGSLTIDRMAGLRLDLALSGSGRLSVGSVQTDNLTAGLLGSGKLTLSGSAKQLRATIQGSGDLDAAGLKAVDAVVTADTAGNIALSVARTVKVRSTGSGNVEIIGAPSCAVQSSGAGQVRCGRPAR